MKCSIQISCPLQLWVIDPDTNCPTLTEMCFQKTGWWGGWARFALNYGLHLPHLCFSVSYHAIFVCKVVFFLGNPV